MTRNFGLERSETGMREGLALIEAVERTANGEPALLNMTAAAKLVASAALARRESRGAHFRIDYPQTDRVGLRSRLTLADADGIAAEVSAQCPVRAHA
jgi:L-aspartate oxidase